MIANKYNKSTFVTVRKVMQQKLTQKSQLEWVEVNQ